MANDAYTDTSKLMALSETIVLPLLNVNKTIHSFMAYSAFLSGANIDAGDAAASIKTRGAYRCSPNMRPYGLMHDVVIFDNCGQLICIAIDIDDVHLLYTKQLQDGICKIQPGSDVNPAFVDFAWRDGLSVEQAIECWLSTDN